MPQRRHRLALTLGARKGDGLFPSDLAHPTLRKESPPTILNVPTSPLVAHSEPTLRRIVADVQLAEFVPRLRGFSRDLPLDALDQSPDAELVGEVVASGLGNL